MRSFGSNNHNRSGVKRRGEYNPAKQDSFPPFKFGGGLRPLRIGVNSSHYNHVDLDLPGLVLGTFSRAS